MRTVRLTNSYTIPIFVAYSRVSDVCGADCGDPWEERGWVGLDVGETETRTSPDNGRWFYYYAEANDGSIWGGDYDGVVRKQKFDKCTCHGTTAPGWYKVGMDEVDLDTHGGVNFIP
jgi:Protein of unknown function (DUF1036)